MKFYIKSECSHYCVIYRLSDTVRFMNRVTFRIPFSDYGEGAIEYNSINYNTILSFYPWYIFMKRIPGLVIILGIFILITGCSIPATTVKENTYYPSGDDIYIPPSPAEKNGTPIPAPAFPGIPVILSEKYRSPSFLGSFEDSFIGSYECTNASESYGTNYTLFTGSGGLSHIHYTLVPLDNMDDFNEVPLPSAVLNASIFPDDFVAFPDHIYRTQVVVTVGSNVTGESHMNPDGSGWGRNPYFPFFLKVTVDGNDTPGADDQLSVIKWCNLHSQTREMQPSPDIETNIPDVTLKPGDEQSVNITIRNFGGGIREIYFQIPARINRNNWTFPLEADPGQLIPIPGGMHFTFSPPVLHGRNFRVFNDTLVIATGTGTPAGNYTFPLVLCYRDLDPDNVTSPYFPFDGNSWCPTAAQFNVDVV